MVENASLFLSYEGIQDLIRYVSHRSPQEKLPLYHLTVAAAGAGAITSFILCVGFLSLVAESSILYIYSFSYFMLQNTNRACQMQNASSDAFSTARRC